MSVQEFRPRFRPQWAIDHKIDYEDRVKTYGIPDKGIVVGFDVDQKIVHLKAGRDISGRDYVVPVPIEQIKMSKK